jgi:hypothetical protein
VALRVGLPGAEVAPAPQRHAVLGIAVNRAFALAARELAGLAPPRARHPGGRRKSTAAAARLPH